ncbi:sensor histidine kinase [Microbacterium sp. W4I20]|uniref:sensor histidine kinase n=1 Tax=Microbacterium sp. W4I20 TaxID=3042262 RepID=UPI0027D78D38|nr:sensor histidine kinase [Microbacterium sp. W4I20]
MTGLWRSAWSAPRAVPAPPRRVWRDWALVALVAVLAVIEALFRTDLQHPLFAVIALFVLLPTVLWRRTKPLAMLLIVMVPLELLLPGSTLYSSLFVLVNVYALFRWGAGRDLVIGSAVLIVSLSLTFVRGGGLDDLIGGFALLLTVVLLGIAFRYRAGSRQRNLAGIRIREREHLARDLHDTVAHHVTAIAIRAQAGLAVAERDPRAAQDALTVIEAEAAKTLSELRSMVRVLRQGDTAELAPSPRLADIEQLAGMRPGGAEVAVTVVGDDGSIPPPVAAAVFRLAQESVTNALRHARQVSRVDVRVEADAGGLRVTVTNDGDVAASPTPGFGIIGMRERAALLGGTCQAGPAPGGGWAVIAVLPRAGWAS